MNKITLIGFALAALLSTACGPDKTKACEGCQGSKLHQCQVAYEECGNVKHCSPGDIKREWSEGACLQESE